MWSAMVQNVLVFATSNLSQLVHALSIVVENTSLPSANRRSNSDLSQCLRLKTKPFPAPHQTNKAKDTSLTYTPTSIKSTVVNVMFSAYTSLTEYIDGRKQVLLISPCQEKLNTLNFFWSGSERFVGGSASVLKLECAGTSRCQPAESQAAHKELRHGFWPQFFMHMQSRRYRNCIAWRLPSKTVIFCRRKVWTKKNKQLLSETVSSTTFTWTILGS